MITPYLNFSGNCEAAFKYYEKHLGGKVDMMMRYADAPPERFHKPMGFSVSLTVMDLADAERKFKALSQGGTEIMPFGKTFFAKGFGMCRDQFDIPWMVNCPAEGM